MTTIYADNAATTQMSRAAIDTMLPYLETIYGNPSSLHSVGQQAAGALLSARDRIAKCLNASPREIYFTSGGSEADNQAIISAARNGARKGKKHLISTKFEHHAVLHTLDKLRKEGFDVTQATVSRDIRELQLVKTATADGRYRYVPASASGKVTHSPSRFEMIFRESVLKVDYAGHMVLVKCFSGMANAACEVFDAKQWDNVVGTLSGDDTFFILMRSEDDAAAICKQLQQYTRRG